MSELELNRRQFLGSMFATGLAVTGIGDEPPPNTTAGLFYREYLALISNNESAPLTNEQLAKGHIAGFYDRHGLDPILFGPMSLFNETDAWQYQLIVKRMLQEGGVMEQIIQGGGNASAVMRDISMLSAVANRNIPGGVTDIDPTEGGADLVSVQMNPGLPQSRLIGIHEFFGHAFLNAHPIQEAFKAQGVNMSEPTQEAMAFAISQIVKDWDPNLITQEEIDLVRWQIATHAQLPMVVGGANTPDWWWAHIDSFRTNTVRPDEDLFLLVLQSMGAELANKILREVPQDELAQAVGEYIADPTANKGKIGEIVRDQQNFRYIPKYNELPVTQSGLTGFAGVNGLNGETWTEAPDGTPALLVRALSFIPSGADLDMYAMSGVTAYYFDASGVRHEIDQDRISLARLSTSDYPVIIIKDKDKQIGPGGAVLGLNINVKDSDGPETGALDYILPVPAELAQSRNKQQISSEAMVRMIDDIQLHYTTEQALVLVRQLQNAWAQLDHQRQIFLV